MATAQQLKVKLADLENAEAEAWKRRRAAEALGNPVQQMNERDTITRLRARIAETNNELRQAEQAK